MSDREIVQNGQDEKSQSKALVRETQENGRSISAFATADTFATAQRMAKALAGSDMVPKMYRGNVPNCLVAMELANRTGASILMVMQNLDVIHGKPSWRSTFLIAAVNSCGRFTPLRFEEAGERDTDDWSMRATARDRKTGEPLEGEWITWRMAKDEGWVDRSGSKWKTMPGQMMRYRAAAFWTRVYAPEIALGMHTADEVSDMGPPPDDRRKRLAALLDGVDPDPAEYTEDEMDAYASEVREARDRSLITPDEAGYALALIEEGQWAEMREQQDAIRSLLARAKADEAKGAAIREDVEAETASLFEGDA